LPPLHVSKLKERNCNTNECGEQTYRKAPKVMVWLEELDVIGAGVAVTGVAVTGVAVTGVAVENRAVGSRVEFKEDMIFVVQDRYG
jgi:hypothetical protein